MNPIVVAIDREIARLQAVRSQLIGEQDMPSVSVPKKQRRKQRSKPVVKRRVVGRPVFAKPASKRKFTMTPEERAKRAAGQRERWARIKALDSAKSTEGDSSPGPSATTGTSDNSIS